jgi:hypothetical protein
LHDHGVVLEQLALVDQYTLRDLRQHAYSLRLWFAAVETVVPQAGGLVAASWLGGVSDDEAFARTGGLG